MIHVSLCNGLGLQACFTCKRYVEHYGIGVLASNTNRIVPQVDPPQCKDWLAMPTRATNNTHDKL